MIIKHNISSINTSNKLQINREKTAKNLEKLSTGLRINRAGDDAAGLAISEKMRGQIRGLDMAGKNIQDGISLIQTAEGGLGNIQNPNLIRLRELAIQAANDTLTDDDRQLIQKEVEQIKQGINEIANNTHFNGFNLLNRFPNQSNNPIDLTIDSKNLGTNESLMGITHNGSQYVVVGGNGTILISTDGVSWTDKTSGMGDALYDVTWGKGKFVVVGSSGRILTSTDGASWFNRPSGTTDSFWGIDYNGSQFVTVGNNGTILTSTEGTSWTSQFSGTVNTLREVTWGGNQYVAVGDNGTILTSTDGTSWTSQSSGTTDTLMEVAYNGSQFVAVGDNGTILTSTDGTSWTSQSSGTTDLIIDVVGEDNIFLASTINGKILHSANGQEWEVEDASVNNSRLDGIIWDGDKFLIVGDQGELIEVSNNNTNNKSDKPQLTLQVGANTGESFSVELTDARTEALGIDDINLSTRQGAESAISKIDEAIAKVSTERGKFGAYQNRLEHTYNSVMNTSENLHSAESRIRDTDTAKEMMSYTKNNILTQAAQAMLAQSNQQPESGLQLLQ